MWPRLVSKADFLLDIYGHYPSLDDVEVTEMFLSREGSSARIAFLSNILPYKAPAYWKPFNRVHFRLFLVGIESVQVEKFGRVGQSQLRMWDESMDVRATCKGAVDFDIRFRHLIVDRVSGLAAG